jgi:signal peptidase II
VTSTGVGGRRWLIAGTVTALVVLVDQLTKHWALSALADGHIIEVVWTLQFRLAFNTGMSFSMGSGMGRLIAPLAMVVVVGLLWTARRIDSPLGVASIGLVSGGALGNLVDRAFREGEGFLGGAVVDFIDLQWWPVFNVADMGIVIGAVLLVISTWSESDAREGDAREGDAREGDARDTA